MDPEAIAALTESWGYPLLLVMLLLTGIGSPVPEDVLLLTAGYLTYTGALQSSWAHAVSWCGVVGSDVMLYAAGRHLAWHASRWPEGHFLSPARLRRATSWFDQFGNITIFVARLVPGTRAVVFATAGLRGVPLRTFVGYVSLGAAVWVPVTLAVGRSLGPRLGDVAEAIDTFQRASVWVAAAIAVLLVVWLTVGREQSKL